MGKLVSRVWKNRVEVTHAHSVRIAQAADGRVDDPQPFEKPLRKSFEYIVFGCHISQGILK